jgi:hypothetical protein
MNTHFCSPYRWWIHGAGSPGDSRDERHVYESIIRTGRLVNSKLLKKLIFDIKERSIYENGHESDIISPLLMDWFQKEFLNEEGRQTASGTPARRCL